MLCLRHILSCRYPHHILYLIREWKHRLWSGCTSTAIKYKVADGACIETFKRSELSCGLRDCAKIQCVPVGAQWSLVIKAKNDWQEGWPEVAKVH